MAATHYSDLRKNLKDYMDLVCDDFVPLFVTRKGEGRNVVMLSEENYNNILENMYIMGDRDYYESLLHAKEQVERGEAQHHELIEDADE